MSEEWKTHVLELIVKKKKMWQLEELSWGNAEGKYDWCKFALRLLKYKEENCITSLKLLRLDRSLLGLEFLSFFADDVVLYGNSKEQMEENLKEVEAYPGEKRYED